MIEALVEMTESPCVDDGTEIFCDERQSGLEYADDVVPLNEDTSKLGVLLDRLDDSVFGIRFAPSKRKMVLPYSIGWKLDLILA